MREHNHPKLSVLVAVYNVEYYIEECLRSLHSQSYADVEFVIIDDGSTDSSGKICDEFQAIDKRFRVIHFQKNLGLLLARKCAIEHCTGQYVIFLDGDDLLQNSECLKDLASAISLSDFDILGFPIEVFGDNNVRCSSVKNGLSFQRVSTITSSQEILKAIFSDSRLMTWTIWNKCYKAHVVKNVSVLIPDEHVVMAEDVFLVFLFASNANNFKTLDISPVIAYRLGTGVSTKPISKASEFQEIVKCLRIIKFLRNLVVLEKLQTSCQLFISYTLDRLLRNTLNTWSTLPSNQKVMAFEFLLKEGFYPETLKISAKMFGHKESDLLLIMEGVANYLRRVQSSPAHILDQLAQKIEVLLRLVRKA